MVLLIKLESFTLFTFHNRASEIVGFAVQNYSDAFEDKVFQCAGAVAVFWDKKMVLLIKLESFTIFTFQNRASQIVGFAVQNYYVAFESKIF